MKHLCIDGTTVDSLADIHTYFSTNLDFPASYGRNMDALYDCLTDVAQDVTVQIVHREELYDTIGRYEKILVRVLRDAAKVNDRIHLDIEEETE